MLEKNGLLLIDKPAGWTSHDVVAKARRVLGMKTIGHSGTLDPMATGLMVLLLGESTKLSQYILEKDKTYELQWKLGVKTATFDAEGAVTETLPVDSTEQQIRAACESLTGELELQVPAFSAIKVQGEKLYDKARRGDDFIPPMKLMKFFDLKITELGPDTGTAQISCSKGSYIRTWVHELGLKLGCGAHLTALRRTRSEPYEMGQGVSFDELEAMVAEDEWKKGYVPMSQALNSWKVIRAQGNTAHLLSNGQISHDLKANLIRVFRPGEDPGVQVIGSEGQILALIGIEPGRGFVLRRVFRY